MKSMLLRLFAVLLAFSLMTGFTPISASASDNELVLTKIGHTNTDTVNLTNPASRTVTLTVPFSYGGNMLDLSTGLTIDKATSIDTVVTSFGSGSAAEIGDAGRAGAPVVMTVIYYKGGNTATQYTAEYSISIVRAARKNPAFTGTITKTVSGVMPNGKVDDITFTLSDFADLYTANDGGPLTAVSITGNSLSCGALKTGSGSDYTNYVSGTPISLNDIGGLVFDATGGGTVSYIVSAYAGADTSNAIGAVLLTITVNAVTVPAIGGTLAKSVTVGGTYTFTLNDFSSLYSLKGGVLDSIEITPANTGSGVWKNGSTTFTGKAAFTAATIGNLKFTASTAGTAAFTWRVSNEAGFSEAGSGTMTVKTAAAPTITSAVVKSVNLGATLTFTLSDFSSCYSLNNGTLNTIVITPSSSSYGTWYKGSSAFTGSKTFNAGDIGTLKFKATKSGQAAFTWTVSNEKGTSATGSGMVTVNAVISTVSYATPQGTPKRFTSSDFNAASRDSTGTNLNYVYFALPSASAGSLYYGYASPSNPGTAITANTAVYYTNNKSPNISNITFVPAENYTGTVTISYTGVNTNGISYTGYVKIIVGDAGDVSYFTPQNTIKTFSGPDFNAACARVTGSGLNYVYFTLPSGSCGTLYYGYSSAANPGAAVTSNNPFSLQNISYVTFVPAAGFTGAVAIPYTGVGSNNVSYTGYVRITVGASPAVSYTTKENRAVVFSASDFNTACYSMTGANLNGVYFTMPPLSCGRLYYSYSSLSNYDFAVSSGTPYYRDYAPYIDSVAFVPAADYDGTVTIAYTGYATNGTSYSGNIVIKVEKTIGSSRFTDIGPAFDWAAGAIDYLYDAGIVIGSDHLYSPGADMTRGDFILMLCRAMGFSGGAGTNFSDVPKGSYYYDAIAAAKALGIAQGNNNKFFPNAPLTRQDAFVLIYRALQAGSIYLPAGKSGDISGFTDKRAISDYALSAIQTLVKAGLIKGSNLKLNPTAILSRAELAVILYRIKIAY